MSFVKYLAPVLAGSPLDVFASFGPAGIGLVKKSGGGRRSGCDPGQSQERSRREKREDKKVVVHKKVVYRPGGVYRVAPVGWRRIGARPVYWQTAGCILVAGIWYCP